MTCGGHPPIVSVCSHTTLPLCRPQVCPPGSVAHLEQVSYTTTCTVVCKFCGSKNVVRNGVRTGNIQSTTSVGTVTGLSLATMPWRA
jgi:hypothetical protein